MCGEMVLCPECGYDLCGQTVLRCPECGFHYDLPALRMVMASRICAVVRPQLNAIPLLLASLCLMLPRFAEDLPIRWLAGTILVFVSPLLRRQTLSWTLAGSFGSSIQREWVTAVLLSSSWMYWLLGSALIGVAITWASRSIDIYLLNP